MIEAFAAVDKGGPVNRFAGNDKRLAANRRV